MTARGRPRHPDILTPAEWRTVNAVRHGMTNRAIAERRGISVDAVKFHVANALEKLELRRRADLRHWRGAPSTSPLQAQRTSQGEIMNSELKLGPIGQIARRVSDVDAAVKWYRDVLGLPLLYQFGDLAFFDCNGTRLFLSDEDDGPSAANSILYFRVDDINAAFDALSAKGVKFVGAPHMIFKHPDGTEEWMAFFKDVDDGTLALMSQVRQ
jgi:DNA-binding CsgD family transcriptional regulator/catechol 2,3-dioxygenase-like lactoylglutathione lyase family enzyme